MTRLIAVAFIGALLASVLAGALSLSLLSCFLFVIFFLLISEDCRRIRDVLKAFTNEEKRRLRGTNSSALTSDGRSVFTYLEALLFRTHALQAESEIRRRSARSLTASLDEEAQGILETSSSLSDATNRYLSRLAAEVALRTQTKTTAIVVELSTREGGQSRFVASSGINSRRFESALQRLFLPFFAWKYYECFESETEDAIREELALHGFRSFLSFPLETVNAEQQFRAALWLGYASRSAAPDKPKLSTLVEEILICTAKFLEVARLHRGVKDAEERSRNSVEAIAHFSHDLRSPLHNIRAVLQLLHSDEADPERGAYLGSAIKNCEHLGEVVSDLLDFSRLHLGNLVAHPASFSLRDLLLDLSEAYRSSAQIKGLNFQIEAPQGTWVANADRGQVRRILSNLVSNAIKYTKRGAVKISLARSGDGILSVRVQDTGLGLSADQLKRLFSPFTRFHADAAEGLGIGLALSRVLAELNRGALHVVSQEGRGSEFQLSLPEGVLDSPLLKDLGSIESIPKVLLVDDDPTCLESLTHALTRLGLAVEKAHDAADALHLLSDQRFDAVISDVSMPRGGLRVLLDGIATLPFHPPVAALSGDDHLSGELKAKGVSEVLLKPANPVHLKEWVVSVTKTAHKEVANSR